MDSLISEGSAVAGIIRDGFLIKIASGQATSFWSDSWLGEMKLEKVFPRLFSLSTQKLAKVCEVYNFSSLTWNLQFRRNLFQWELGQLQIFQQMLLDVAIHDQGEDKLRWRWDQKSGNFSVKSCYGKWEWAANVMNPIGPKCMLIWKNLCPFKAEILTWQAIQDKLATGSELVKRNIYQQEEGLVGLCPFCKSEIETAVHLLLHCKVSWKIWSLIMQWWNIEWVCPQNLYTLMCWWDSFKYKSVEKGCWDICFYVVLWLIWLERNQVIFRNKVYHEVEMIENIKNTVAIWTKACFDLRHYSVEDFKRCLPGIRSLKLQKLMDY